MGLSEFVQLKLYCVLYICVNDLIPRMDECIRGNMYESQRILVAKKSIVAIMLKSCRLKC